MNNTFNVKIVVFLILLIISFISLTSFFLFEVTPFKGDVQFYIPLIIAMIFTLIRFYNNLVEKSKIVENIKKQREDLLDQATIKFNTCPDYWTKTTNNDTVLCRNYFTDKDGKTMVIGGKLSKIDSSSNINLITNDSASNIGFAEFYNSNDNTFDNLEYTYIPQLRSNIQLSETKNSIENFTQSDDSNDNVPHIHEGTAFMYTPTDKEVIWSDGADRDHGIDKLKNEKHYNAFNYRYAHNHNDNFYYNLDFEKYNPEKGKFEIVMNSNAAVSSRRMLYSNDTNWISPYEHDNNLYAEINLNELNKASNKCELVKYFPWVEAKSKCDNVNM